MGSLRKGELHVKHKKEIGLRIGRLRLGSTSHFLTNICNNSIYAGSNLKPQSCSELERLSSSGKSFPGLMLKSLTIF
jgi:hypothetical protein